MVIKELSKASSSALEGASPDEVEWLTASALTVVVVGASGDLAKKKTFPSLFNLYRDGLLPDDTVVWGYARSKLTDDELRERIRPYLLQEKCASEEIVDKFLSICRYQGGSTYGDLEAFTTLKEAIEEREVALPGMKGYNRLFYFAIPSNVFAETGLAIRQTCMQDEAKGWTRLIVEKPFGRNLETSNALGRHLTSLFEESQVGAL